MTKTTKDDWPEDTYRVEHTASSTTFRVSCRLTGKAGKVYYTKHPEGWGYLAEPYCGSRLKTFNQALRALLKDMRRKRKPTRKKRKIT